MNRPVLAFAEHPPANSTGERRRTHLDALDASRAARHVVAYTPSAGEIREFFERARSDLGSLASLEVARRVMSANPDTFHAFAFRDRHDAMNPKAAGYIAWLPLTGTGLAALTEGAFDGTDPRPEHVAGQNDAPAAIYVWGLYAPGRLATAVAWAYQRWSTPLCRNVDIFARAATVKGRRLIERLGFDRCRAEAPGKGLDLYVFRRSAKRAQTAERRPPYDTYPSDGTQYTVAVVRSADDLAKVMAIRSAAFLGEQACPFDEEFDGNDFSSTHLLGFVDNEPAASIRVRWFADFCKAERLAVRSEFRRSRLAFVLVKAAHELCRVKGYRRIYGHAQIDLVDFWSRAGGRPFPGAREFTFSDHRYVEMMSEVLPHPDAIGIGADPYLIIRPEGRWHTPGPLEHSASRPVATHIADPAVRRQRRA